MSVHLLNERHFGEWYLIDIHSFEFLKCDFVSSRKILFINEFMDVYRGGPGGTYSIYINGDYGVLKSIKFTDRNDYTIYSSHKTIREYQLNNTFDRAITHVLDSNHYFFETLIARQDSYHQYEKFQEIRCWDIDSSNSRKLNIDIGYYESIIYSFNGSNVYILKDNKSWIIYDLENDTVIKEISVFDYNDAQEINNINENYCLILFKDRIRICTFEYCTIVKEYIASDESLYSLKVNNTGLFYCLSKTNRIIRFHNPFEQNELKSLFYLSDGKSVTGDEVFFYDISKGEPDSYF